MNLRNGEPFFVSLKENLEGQFFSEEGFSKIVEIAKSHPLSFCQDGVILESILSEKKCSSADVSYFLKSPSSSLLKDVARFKDKGGMWNTLNRLLIWWSKKESLTAQSMRGIWLEFDAKNFQVPSIFVSLRPECSEQKNVLKILKELSLEVGAPYFSEVHTQNAVEFVMRLPKEVQVHQIGFMGSRENSPLKLCLSTFSHERLEIGAFLKRSGYQLDLTHVEEVLKELMLLNPQMYLSMDLGEEAIERIGFEFSSKGIKGPAQEELFYDLLVQKGLCSPENRHNLLNFRRREEVFVREHPWLKQFNRSNDTYLCTKSISHCKLSFIPKKTFLAKSYLWFHYAPKPLSIFSSELKAEILNLSEGSYLQN